MTISQDTVKGITEGHRSIVAALDQVYSVSRSYPKAILKLHELNDMLSSHIGRQDREFYEQLTSFYADDNKTSKMLEFLIYDLNELRIQHLEFFDKYLYGVSERGARNFSKDLKEFGDKIVLRVTMEEDYLFPLLKNYRT